MSLDFPLYASNWKDIAKMVKKRDNYTCQKCKKKFPPNSYFLNVHHKIPLSKGGTNSPDNLICICHECHCGEHKHMQSKNKKKVIGNNKTPQWRF